LYVTTASLSLVTAVAVSVCPSCTVPLTVTDRVGAASVTAAVAALFAEVPPPSLSVEVATTRSWCVSFASATT
jgi:hypothetical protein